MGEKTPNPIDALVAEARERISQEVVTQAQQLENLEKLFQEARERVKQEISAHAEQLETLQNALGKLRERQKALAEETEQQLQQLAEKSLGEARERHNGLKMAVDQQLDQLAKYEPPPPPVPVAPLDKLLSSVRNLITATLPEQVLETLTEESEQLGVRTAVFDVRGKAAWGSSARGFADLSAKVLRSIIVPLNQDGPFRQVFETGGHVDARADQFKKNRNILDKLKPGSNDEILLLPIRSAGSVSAIVYMDAGGHEAPLPVDALKILAEFAGAQLDRLMALSGGGAVEAVEEEPTKPEAEPESAAEAEAAPPKAEHVPEAAPAAAAAPTAVEAAPAAPPAPEPPPAAPPPSAPPAAAGFDVSQLSAEEQKYHKDAKRFAKLLVSEIELYNKPKVADGRKNKDLYKRLKSDIDRSRQTFQKRFSKPMPNQVDYLHDELVRLLANNDASLLGPEYPGPSA